MIPKAILEKAIEGGYLNLEPGYTLEVYNNGRVNIFTKGGVNMGVPEEKIVLSPSFWQALKIYLPVNWRTAAQLFYETILTGGDTEKFWEELLK